ncbi:MAG: type II secretion system F family protein, partial [Victivallales bacterium]
MNLNGPYYIESQHFYSGIGYFVKTLAFAANNNIPFYEAIDGFRREEKDDPRMDDVKYKGGKRSYLFFLPIYLLVLFFVFKVMISLMRNSIYIEDVVKWTVIILSLMIIFPVAMFVMGKKKLRSFIVVKNPSFRSQLLLVSEDLRKGVSLSEALNRRLHGYFPDYLLLAIEKADKEKKLKEVLPQLAENIGFVNGIKNEIKASFTYPVVQFANLS